MPCVECHHTECACDCATCEATRRAADRGEIAPCQCHPCRRWRADRDQRTLRDGFAELAEFENRHDTLDGPQASEIADIEARLKLLREASRPSEPLTGTERMEGDGASTFAFQTPTAQGHILSAITQLERRRAELLAKGPR